jgi:UvrD-like helicase C-terminal domain
MMSGRFQDAIPGLFGALFGAGVLGWGAGWIGFDHGYAVTSHSSQGLTAERVMVNLDSHVHIDLINKRFAYVAVSRGSHDAHIYTDNASSLVSKLSHDVVKSSALQVGQQFPTDQSAGFQM